MRVSPPVVFFALATLVTLPATAQTVVEGTVVAIAGDVLPGDTIAGVNPPFTNGLGQVGFTGSTTGGDNFVWFDNSPVWFNSDGVGLTGAESTMGIGDGGAFIYSPADNGNDAVYTQNGALLVDGDPAPGFPGQFNSFNSRPNMLPDGTAVWVAGVSDTSGGASLFRVLYRSSDTVTPVITVVLAAGDMVGGFPISQGSGIGFDYQLSDDGTHHIQELDLDTGSTANDGVVYVDGAIAAQEGSTTGGADNWDNFDLMSINDDGTYVFSGDTDGATTTDEFIAVDGAVAVREGDVLDGVTLASGAIVRGVSINNNGQVAHAWETSGSGEVLFVGDATDLINTSRRIIGTGDMLDIDADGVGDFTIDDFNASTTVPGLSFAENAAIHIEVDLDGGMTTRDAIIRIPLALFADGFESGDTSAWSATVP